MCPKREFNIFNNFKVRIRDNWVPPIRSGQYGSRVYTLVPAQTKEFLRDESSRTKEFLRDESSRTKEFLSSRCARPNKGTAEQRDSRTKGQPKKGPGANSPPLPADANE